MVTLPKTGLWIIVLAVSLMWGFEAVAVETDGTVYTRVDGTVDPATAPVQRDGSVIDQSRQST